MGFLSTSLVIVVHKQGEEKALAFKNCSKTLVGRHESAFNFLTCDSCNYQITNKIITTERIVNGL